jgi:hypothetical protein
MLLLGIQGLYAKPVDVETARLVAERWTGENLKLPATARALVLSPPADLGVGDALYFFELQPQGLAVVSADDAAHPVIFYTDGKVDLQKGRPPQFDDMIRGAASTIRAAKANAVQALPASQSEWARLTAPAFAPRASGPMGAVLPLLTSHFSQGQYYNANCPYDASSYYASHCLVGCVAVSMSQVMRYYSYPAHGTGSHSYTAPGYGTQTANFGATTYNWAAMPASLSAPNASVATLLYHAGVSVEMEYGTAASLAYQDAARDALVNYFGYSATAQYIDRGNYPNDTTWTNFLYADLDAGRPLVYAGDGPAGGHSFNIDGYSAVGYFHLNWGWEGAYDGYFYLGNLAPVPADTFNNNQCAVVHIVPGSAPGGTDLIANRAYVSSDSNGVNEVTNPQPGDAVYFCLDFSYTGTSALPACSIAMTLDGAQYMAGNVPVAAFASHVVLIANTPWTAAQGSHTQVWTLDPTNSVTESDETNNTAQQTFLVGTNMIDLIAHRAYIASDVNGANEVTSPALGDTLYFCLDYSNTSFTPLPACNIEVKLDGASYLAAPVDFAASTSHAILAVGPWTATLGSHTQAWTLDSTNSVTETDETNNTAQQTFDVTPSTASGDLIAHRVFVSTSVSGTPEVTSANTGTPLYFFIDYSWTGTADLPTCAVAMQMDGAAFAQGTVSVPAGADHYYVYTTLPWSAVTGDHTFQWTLDSNNAIPETDETNNSAQASFTVTSPILSPIATSHWMQRGKYWIMWDPTVLAGKKAKLRLDLYSNGTLFSCIKKKTTNKGSLKFAVKKTVPSGTTYQVVLTELSGQMRVFASDMFPIGTTGASGDISVELPGVSAGSEAQMDVATRPSAVTP